MVKITLTIVVHRLGRTCIHKVGQYYVKPGQIQAAGREEEEEVNEAKGEERSDNEEGLEEESKKTVMSKKPGKIQGAEEGDENKGSGRV